MKITKFVHSCLLVEVQDRTALFDPGMFSKDMLTAHDFKYLDDIIITHEHPDHVDVSLVQQLILKFPKVRVTAPAAMKDHLVSMGIMVETEPREGIEFFDAPHEGHPPFMTPPEQIGVHYLEQLSHPGDSHSFSETKAILALPITAPWGSVDRAVQLALELKPQYIIPIHDWHWRDEVREQTYGRLEELFAVQDIEFIKPKDGEPFVISQH